MSPKHRLKEWTDRALRLLGWGVLASMLVGALHDVSQAWDVWYYHLPFAARIAGIVPTSQFAYDPLNEARFGGFPLFAEALQGGLWRLTGRAESANLVAFSAVPLFAWFVRRRFHVPMHLTIIGLLAVPLVQIHATSCYVDLPGNAAAAALVLVAIQAWAQPDEPMTAPALVLACALGAVAANTKTLLQPMVFASLLALGARLVRERRYRAVLAMVFALPLVFFTPLKNLTLHHNPAYPVAMELFGHHFPGPAEPYSSSPVWLAHAPRPVRFVCSALEIGTGPLRWTVDQWTPPDAPGYRMGGFFGLYVAGLLALLVWRAVRERGDPTVRRAIAGFSLLTVLVSVMPQSHELRYYMGWMIVLVAVNLWLARRSQTMMKEQGVALACAVALGAVLTITRGEYAYASGESFRELVHTEVNDGVLAHVHEGAHVCVRRAPWSFLWAAPFHAPRSYVVQEAEVPADCAGEPSL